MAFDVYPQPQTAPLTVPPGGAGITVDLVQERRSAEAQPTMYIRVALVGGAVAPTFKLQAGTGAAVALMVNMALPINDPSTLPNPYVADAFLTVEANGVFLISVFLYVATASTWKLTIINNDAVARGFTFVAADSDADSKQPWIEAATAIGFNALISETATQTLRLFNHGTGPLTGIGGAPAGPGAASFMVTVPGGASIPPNGNLDILVTLLPVATPQTLAATLDITSNDGTAQKAAGHNSRVALTASVGKLEIAFMLDGSGSMAYGPAGETTLIGIDNKSTRWGRLVTGVQAALAVLQNFGADKGNFAVGMYPNILGFPADPTGPYAGPLPVASPSAADFTAMLPISPANVGDAKGKIDLHFARLNAAATPMGAAIAHAIGTNPGSFGGYFEADAQGLNRRWLILMTDGNDNSHPPFPNDFFGNGTTGQGFVPKKIKVAALGYGNTNAAVEPVNTGLLNQIVTNAYQGSAANYHYAEADSGPDLTAKFIKGLLFSGLTLDSLADPSGVLTPAHPQIVHKVPVTEYDDKLSFIVAWSTYNPGRLIVQVRTPLGEVLEKAGPDYTVDTNPRFRMLTFDRDYLANRADPDNPRYGTWTLLIRLDPKAQDRDQTHEGRGQEPYDYQIIADTRLNLRVEFNRPNYVAGATVGLSAQILLQGLALTGAAVTLTVTAPATSYTNWLANTPVSPRDYNAARERQGRGNPDIDSIGVKQIALISTGLKFSAVENTFTVPMVDGKGNGVYGATLHDTTVPGTYRFLITAVGALPDGTPYRREQSRTVEIVARPVAANTPFQVDYLRIVQNGQPLTQATVTVHPRDRFNNATLLDPQLDPSLAFPASGATFTGPITDNHDGSYTRVLTYPDGHIAHVGVTLNRHTVVPKTLLVDPGQLRYADTVANVKLGYEAAPGANQHTVADACLGDCTTAPDHGYVSLGALGEITLAFAGHSIVGQGHDDLTVFIHADQPPRPYVVEASVDTGGTHWFEVGRSLGVTQTFSLADQGTPVTARMIRIRDTSGQIRTASGAPSATPGVSVLGLGVARLE